MKATVTPPIVWTELRREFSSTFWYCIQCFFYWRNFARRRVFFTSSLFLAKFGPKKKFLSPRNHPFWPFFIHLNPFSSTFRAFIQHPDELASRYVLVVPPGRKTKNHRKNTDCIPLLVVGQLEWWYFTFGKSRVTALSKWWYLLDGHLVLPTRLCIP
jgi:hypothetical protein